VDVGGRIILKPIWNYQDGEWTELAPEEAQRRASAINPIYIQGK
jgi:hypothetical protein